MDKISKYTKNILAYPFHNNSAMIIDAVAGSGKSTNMVKLSISLVKRKIVPATKQKLITFSNRSSKDLQRKINKEFKDKKNSPQVSTIHGLMVKIIKEYFNENITVMSQWQSIVMIRSIMISKGWLDNLEDGTMAQKTKVATEVYQLLDYIKANVRVNGYKYYKADFNMSEYKKSKVISDERLKIVLKEYEQKKNDTDMYDYSDLLFKSIIMLESNPDILEKVRAETKLLIVDEVQDNSLLDWSVILLLAQNQRLAIVGDIDQTIYKFRYADPSKFNATFIGKYFENVVTFPLPINYRSTANIVKLGNIVRYVKDKDGLQAIPHQDSKDGSVQLQKVANTIQEGLQAVNIINENVEAGYKYKDIAIIARTNAYLRQVIEPALVKAKIPYKLSKSAGKKLNERTANLMYFNLLQLSLNLKNLPSIIDLAGYLNGIGDALQQEISEKLMLVGSLDKIDVGNSASKVTAIKKYIDFMSELNVVHNLIKTNQPINEVMNELERLVLKYMKRGIVTDKEQRNIHKTIANYIAYYREETQITKLYDMLNNMLLEIQDFQEPENRDVVDLSTIHQNKGLSQKITIASGFVSHRELKDEYSDEINILYVQLSRAEEKLYILYSDKFVGKNGKVRQGVVNKELRKVLREASKQN